jgi:type VI secretion system secreted protein VgrG
VSVSGEEKLGHPYRYDVRVRATDASTSAGEELIGALATVAVKTAEGPLYMNGYVHDVTRTVEREPTWDIRLVPWTTLLSKTASCAIYAQHDVPSTLKQLLAERAIASYRMQLHGSYPQLPFFVQYRETDLNFFQRLVEHVGIVELYEHGAQGHELILVDGPDGLPSSGLVLSPTSIDGFHVKSKLEASRYTLRTSSSDAAPQTREATSTIHRDALHGDLEIYDYEGVARSADETAFYARLRAEEQESSSRTIGGVARGHAFRAGQVIALTGGGALEGKYLVTSSSISVTASAAPEVAISFEATPQAVMTRPHRVTAWPIINGIQIARAIEIGQNRIKVRFPWARTESSDVWIPIARGASTATAGADVIVEFLDGEPGRPVVTGLMPRSPN